MNPTHEKNPAIVQTRRPSIRDLARAAGVSERLMYMTLKVHREGVPELQPLILAGALNVSEAVLMVEHLLPETQRDWAALPAPDLKRAIRNLRRHLAGQKAAIVQGGLVADLEAVRAGVMQVGDFLERHAGKRIPGRVA